MTKFQMLRLFNPFGLVYRELFPNLFKEHKAAKDSRPEWLVTELKEKAAAKRKMRCAKRLYWKERGGQQ